MDCGRFQLWLDDGMPASAAPDAAAHAGSCARCADEWRVARAIEAALAPASAAAPAGFTERVMTRVAQAPTAPGAGLLDADAIPWWVRAAAEPATALSLALAALVFWQYPTLARVTVGGLHALASPAVADLVRRLTPSPIAYDLPALSSPYLLLGLMLGTLPLAWWAGLAVYHWSGDPGRLAGGRR
jgi:hypothetical protein